MLHFSFRHDSRWPSAAPARDVRGDGAPGTLGPDTPPEPIVRHIDETAIKTHSDCRFRSEYDYALFEYYRSAKVIAYLERAGVEIRGDVLDAGCGGGGMPLSLAEEARSAVGIDITDRFRDAGTRLAAERRLTNVRFVVADGQALPFRDGSFDLLLSHAVIEHVADAPRYLAECARVLRPGGWMYLSTAPYLSFAGAHLPRLKVPIPLHLVLGRRLAFRTFRALARRAPWALREPVHENSFIGAAERGELKQDDLREPVRLGRLRSHIARSGLRIVREDVRPTATIRRAPAPLARVLCANALVRDILTSSVDYVLARP